MYLCMSGESTQLTAKTALNLPLGIQNAIRIAINCRPMMLVRRLGSRASARSGQTQRMSLPIDA